MKGNRVFLKALWIGSTMTVPGVSGGTMAILAGIYEDLIHAVNELKHEPKRQIPFLLTFVAGGGLGFLLFARFITMLLENAFWGVPIRFLFCGIVAGGIPFLAGKTEIDRLSYRDVLYLLLGAGIVLLLGNLPAGFMTDSTGILYLISQVAGGVLVAIALVLPGISTTHMLYILGIYESVMERMYSFQILSLIPLLAGLLAGTFLTADILERCMKKSTRKVYLVILGFVAGSVWELIPREKISHPILCVGIMLAGTVIMYRLSRKMNQLEGREENIGTE